MSVSAARTSEECMGLMIEHRARQPALMIGGKRIGNISVEDLVEHIISEQKFTSDLLEHYIAR
jgi:hypothetical protein